MIVVENREFLDHDLEPIPHPGNELGYFGPVGSPGDLTMWFPPGVDIWQCTKCETLFCFEDNGRVRVPYGSFGPELYDNWNCLPPDGGVE